MKAPNKLSLLSPAGSPEAMIYAVENGADAVYLGLDSFNARINASNFTPEQFTESVKYAHLRGVKVYLTLNTLLTDVELKSAIECAVFAAETGVDAIIVQDIALATAIHNTIPDIPIHASTQLTVYNLEGALKLGKLGFSRVILARETSLKEIKNICANANIEVEVFVHGAVCISWSGQCLMSSCLLNRSGNKGKCAQMCRLPWQLNDNSGSALQLSPYLLSPKDLCNIDYLDELRKAGVCCIKIEGRMKTPSYVGNITRIYRKAIDEHIVEKDRTDLMQSFNRNGFTNLYLKCNGRNDKPGIDMMSWQKPKNWGVEVGVTVGEKSYKDKNTSKSIFLTMVRLSKSISIGDGIEFFGVTKSASDAGDEGNILSEIICGSEHIKSARAGMTVYIGRFSKKIPIGAKVYRTSEKALNEKIRLDTEKKLRRMTGEITFDLSGKSDCVCVTLKLKNGMFVSGKYDVSIDTECNICEGKAERIRTQLSKCGNTPFKIENVHIIASDKELSETVLPVSFLNNIRKNLTDKAEESILEYYNKRYTINKLPTDAELCNNSCETIYSAEKKELPELYTYNETDDSKYDNIILPYSYAFADKSYLGRKVMYRFPAVSAGNCDDLLRNAQDKLMQAISAEECKGLIIGNFGEMYLIDICHKYNKKVIADYTFNVTNAYGVGVLLKLGFDGVIPSIEAEDTDTMRKMCMMYPDKVWMRRKGRIVLMVSDFCPVGAAVGGKTSNSICKAPCKNGTYSISDVNGKKYPILCDSRDCRVRIFSDRDKISETDSSLMPYIAGVIEENYIT